MPVFEFATPTLANPKYLEALQFAVSAHAAVGQARKGTVFPQAKEEHSDEITSQVGKRVPGTVFRNDA